MLPSAALLLVSIITAGCSAMTERPKDSVPVTVSAANFSQLSRAQLYALVVDTPINAHPKTPAIPTPTKPVYYLLLPGEVYPNDITLETVYRELEIAFEQRGYFNAVYQMRAGHMPSKIDYILRVHYGERPWRTPIVRIDGVTWGNDGLVANRYKTHLMSDTSYDPRVGLSEEDRMNLGRALQSFSNFGMGRSPAESIYFGSSWNSFGNNAQLWRDFGEDGDLARDFFLVVIEAFKVDDVRAVGKRAPCIWATFIAVPADRGQKFSYVLRSMIQTGMPYFGETTQGLLAYEVPPGRVSFGTPVEVPDGQTPILTSEQRGP